jgi:hypothetical protein
MSQDATWTVSLDPEEDITGWEIDVVVRAYNGGTALITKTESSGITFTDTANGVFVVSFSAADLTLNTHGPGAYVVSAHRTNSGFTYPITDPSPFIIRPADSTAYPTITNLGEYAAHALLGLTLTDALATQYIQLLFEAEDWVKRYCNRDFPYRASATEYYDGTGTPQLRLKRTPVASIASIYEDWQGNYGYTSGAFPSSSLLTSGENYALRLDSPFNDGLSYSGIVQRIGGVWPYRKRRSTDMLSYNKEPLPGCLKVTYSGGFQLMPHSLKRAVWDRCTLLAERAMSGRLLQSESGEGYSYSIGDNSQASLESIEAALAPFRRYVI